jgi:hypothetical protein
MAPAVSPLAQAATLGFPVSPEAVIGLEKSSSVTPIQSLLCFLPARGVLVDLMVGLFLLFEIWSHLCLFLLHLRKPLRLLPRQATCNRP